MMEGDAPPSPSTPDAGRRSSRVVKRVLLPDYVVDSNANAALATRARVGSTGAPGSPSSPSPASKARRTSSGPSSPSQTLSAMQSPLQAKEARESASFMDDFLLMQGVHQTLDLTATAHEVKFSSAMVRSPAALGRRWRDLLYSQRVSGAACAQLQRHYGRLAEISTTNIPWSTAELTLLREFLLARQSVQKLSPDLKDLATSEVESLLQDNRTIFHPTRNAWWTRSMLARIYQSLTPVLTAASPAAWSQQALARPRPLPVFGESDEVKAALEQELDRNAWKERRLIIALEAESALDKFDEMDKRVLAILRTENKRFEVRARQALIGRSSSSQPVDVDLTDAGALPSRLSRHHALLWLDGETAQFRIYCMGRRPIFVNGEPTPHGSWRTVPNGALVEIAEVPILVRVNTTLTARARKAITPSTSTTNEDNSPSLVAVELVEASASSHA